MGKSQHVVQRFMMAWSSKRRGRKEGYFYRSQRVGGRVVTQYVGYGPAAGQAAAEIGLHHQQRQEVQTEPPPYTSPWTLHLINYSRKPSSS